MSDNVCDQPFFFFDLDDMIKISNETKVFAIPFNFRKIISEVKASVENSIFEEMKEGYIESVPSEQISENPDDVRALILNDHFHYIQKKAMKAVQQSHIEIVYSQDETSYTVTYALEEDPNPPYIPTPTLTVRLPESLSNKVIFAKTVIPVNELLFELTTLQLYKDHIRWDSPYSIEFDCIGTLNLWFSRCAKPSGLSPVEDNMIAII